MGRGRAVVRSRKWFRTSSARVVAFLAQADALAQWSSDVQQPEPGGREAIVSVPFDLHIPITVIALHAVRLQQMGGVIERAKPAMTLEQGVILLSFFALPDAFFSLGVIPIIVILMDSMDDGRGVNQSGAGTPGKPEQPVVPTGPADYELWNLFMEQTLSEDEVIDPLRGPLAVRMDGQRSNFFLPA